MGTKRIADQPGHGRGIQWIGDTDPGAVGPGEVWMQESGGGGILWIRNAADTAWLNAGTAVGVPASVIVADTAAIADTEAVIVGLLVPAGSLRDGSTFRVHAAGQIQNALTPGNMIFRIRMGPTTLTGVLLAQVDPTAAAGLGAAFAIDGTAVIRVAGTGGTGVGAGDLLVTCFDPDRGGLALTAPLQNGYTGGAGVGPIDDAVDNLLELTVVSGASDSTCTATVAYIEQVIS